MKLTLKKGFVVAVTSEHEATIVKFEINGYDTFFENINGSGFFSINDYRDDEDVYLNFGDDGTIWENLKVLEESETLEGLTINPTSVNIPDKDDYIECVREVDKFIYGEDCRNTFDMYDLKAFSSHVKSLPFMYDLIVKNNDDYEKALVQYMEDIFKERSNQLTSMTSSIENMMTNLNIDTIEDENGDIMFEKP